MGVEEKTTHVAEIDDLQLEQFRDSTNMNDLIAVYVERVQELEENIFDVRSAFWLDDAVGIQLDIVGDIVGLTRQALTDDLYRNAIRMQIIANGSDGTVDDLLSLFTQYSDAPVTWREYYQAAIVFTSLTAASDVDRVMYFLDQAKSAGVKLQIVFDETGAFAPFRFSSTSSTAASTTTGFAASGAATAGGHLLGVY